MSAVEYIQGNEFQALMEGATLVVVDFTATWCGPCKLVAPLMDQLAAEYGEQVKIVKVDLDKNQSMAQKFNIRSIPAVLVFKDGEVVETLVGVKPYSMFQAAVSKNLSASST